MSTTPAKNLLPVALTPAINLCHGFSVIAGVVDTGEQFITGDVRHVTGNDKDYLRTSPEWFGRNPRLTKGHYRVYCQPMLPVKLEV